MRLSDLLTEDLLMEGRKDDAIKLFRTWQSPYQQHATVPQPFQDLEIPKFVEVIFNQDPSGTHKYANWVIKHGIFPYVGNAPFNSIISSAERGDEWDINEDDAVRKIAQTLNYVREFDELLKKNRLTQHFFKKYLSKYNIQQPIMDNPGDINNYDYEDLTSMLRRVGMAEEDIQAQKNLQRSSDDVYNGKYMSVKKPKTEEASCLLGRDTRWCVSSKKGDYFKSYTRKGDLFFFDFSGLMSDLRGKYNKIAYLHKYDDPMGSEWWNAQDDKVGYGDDAWDTMRSGIKAEALLSDEEADEVMEEMKEAYTEIHREHLDGEKEEKYDWLGTKNTAERKYRGIMNHVRSAINAVFGDVKKGIEVDGKKYSKVSENIGTAQKTGKFHWHIKLRDIGNTDIMKSHRVSKEELKKIFEYLKEEISKTNLKAVVKYMKDFKIFLGESGWSGYFVIDTPETIEVNEGLSFMGILGEDKDKDGIPDRLDVKDYKQDTDEDPSDNKDLCDEITVNSEKELRDKMRGMSIPAEDKKKIEKEIINMRKDIKDLDIDGDVTNTYMRRIQNMICTFSKEDKKNIDESLSFANILNEGVFQKRGVCPISQEEEDAIYDRVEKAGEEFQKIYDIMVKKHNVKDTNSPNITPYLYKDKTDQEAFIKIYKEYRAAKKAHKEYEEVYLVNRMERGDDVFTTEDEYYALVRLYKLSPDHFAKPYKSVKDDKGCITGYDVEEVVGETLEKSVNVTPELFAQIEDVVKMMHQKGEAHGDLHGGNIIVTDNGKGFKIIDPAGYPPKYKDLSRAMKRDLDTLAKLKSGTLNEDTLSFANILTENRIEDSIKMFYSPEDADTAWYQQLLNIDPSGEHAYLIPLLSLIKKEYPEIFKPDGRLSRKHLYIQDLTATLGETLKYFHNYKNRFNKETIHKAIKSIYPDSKVAYKVLEDLGDNLKDMASYSSLDVFKFIVDSVRHLPSAKEIRDIKKSGSKKIYDDEDYLVVVPETEAASCYYGAGTQWCTAGRSGNAFEDYTGRQGVLYYVVDKRARDMKYAIHMTFDQLLSDDFNYATYTIYDEEDNDVENGKWRSKGDLDTSGAIPMDMIFQRAVNAIEADYEQRVSKMKQEIGKSKEKSNEWTDADEYMTVKVMMTEEGEKNHGRQNITLYLAVPDDEWGAVNGWVEVDDFLISKMEQVLGMDSVSADDVEEITIEKTYDTRREYCTDAMKKTSYNQMVCQEEKTYTDREVLDVIGTNMPADTWKEVAAANGYEEIEDGKWILPQLMESAKLSFANIINEGRVDDAEKFFDEGIYGKIGSNERSWKIPPWFDKLKKIDPSGNQAYLLPILRLIRKGFPSMKGLLSSAENYYIQGRVDELENTLLYFHHNKNRFTSDDTEVELETINRPGMTIEDEDKLIAAPRDIANYWSLHLFNLLVRKMMRHPSAKEKREILKSGVKKIYDDEDHLVVVPETEAASCFYGAGTKWCTAATSNNAFKDYTGDKGVLYYIIYKKSSQGVKNAIQMGFELRADDHDYSTYSVWDEEDKDVTAGLFGKWQSKGDLKTDHIPKHLLSAIESDYEERLNKMKEPEKIDESKLSLTGIILAEGRADDAYQKWVLDYWNDEPVSPNDRTTSRGWTKKAYEELVELDKEALGGDNKYLEWGLKQFVVNKRSILEIKLVLKDFVKYKDKILPVLKDKDIKLPGVLKDKMDHIRKNPLDINTYGVATLKRMMDVAKTHISKSELKKIIKDEADLIYQDERFMVVEPHTHRASCHFGMGTKWCTTEKGSDNYFRSHTKGDQRLMYIIDKSKKMFDPETKEGDKLSKVAMHMNDNGQFTFYNAPDDVIKMEQILNDETGLTDKIPLFKSMFKSSLYTIIKKVQEEGGKLEGAIPRGIEIGEGITHIEGDRISFNFGDDLDVFNTYMLFDEYVLSMIRDILSPYGSHEYYDSYQADEDWDEGYILQSLDDASVSELKDYLEITDPTLVKYLEGDDQAAGNDENLKELAYQLKERQTHADLHDTIVEAYMYAENTAMEVGVEKMLNERLRDLLNSYGFEFEDEWTYRIDYTDLIKLYEDAPSVNMNMQMLMNWLSEENDGWFNEYELNDNYEHKDYDRFSEELNGEVRRYLENFMGNEEQLEKGSKIADAWLELHKHGINKDTKFDSADGEVIVVRLYDPEDKKFELDVFTNSEDGNMNKKTEKKLSTSDVVALKTQKELPFGKEEETEEEQINELGQSYDGHELGDEFNQAYLKVARVVNSADSIGQLKVAMNMLDQLQKKYPKMEITSRDYRFLSGSIIRKMDKLKNIVETYESDDTIRKIAKMIGGDIVVGREDYVYDLWVNEGVRGNKKKNFTLTIDESGVLSYETIMDEVILGHVAEGSKKLSNKVIDILTESKVSKKDLLIEGRVDKTKKKYPKVADNDAIFKHLLNSDPTGNNKYLMWMAKIIDDGWKTKKEFNYKEVTRAVERFHDLVEKGLIKNKDINSYKTFEDFMTTINDASTKMSKSEMKRQIKEKDIELIYDEDPGVKIYVPKTKAASCLLGVNTKWCTASKTSKNYFDQYTREGFLFYIFAGGSNPRKWALHVDQNGKREFWNAQDMKMDSFDLTDEEEIAVETYMDNHEDEKWDEINKRLKVAVDTAVKQLDIDRTRIGEVIKTSEPYMNFVSYEIRYYPGTEGDVPKWVDVKVFNKSDLKAYVKDFVDTDFAEHDAGIILGYQNGHLEDAINKGWFDYDKYMEEEAEDDLYDEDGGFLPDSKSQEDILEFIEDEVSMDTLGKYIDMEKIYKSYEDSLELTVPDPIAQVKEGEYTLLLTNP